MVRRSVALAVLVLFASVGTVEAQDRKLSLMRSFTETDDFSVQRIYSGKKSGSRYLSEVTRVSDELIQVEVLQDLAGPIQLDDAPQWRSEGTVLEINCKNFHYRGDIISYQFSMGVKVLERWSDDKYMRKRLANRRWFTHETPDFMARIKGEKRPVLINDIKQPALICPRLDLHRPYSGQAHDQRRQLLGDEVVLENLHRRISRGLHRAHSKIRDKTRLVRRCRQYSHLL